MSFILFTLLCEIFLVVISLADLYNNNYDGTCRVLNGLIIWAATLGMAIDLINILGLVNANI